MKSILFGAAALAALALAAPAFAASPTSDYSWTGFYAGAHVGYGWGAEDWKQTTSSDPALTLDRSVSDVKLDGVTGGVQAGYDYQSGPWVFGVGGDWSWNDQKGSAGHAVYTSYAGQTDNDWTATVRARAGFARGHVMAYALGGAAFAHDKSLVTFSGADTANTVSHTRTGYLLGGGIETAVTPNWTVGLEYNYMDYGTEKATFTYTAHPAGLVEGWNLKAHDQLIRLNINYRFGG